MVVCRRPLLLLPDLVGLGALALLAGAAARWIAEPLWRSWHDLPAIREELSGAHAQHDLIATRNVALQASLDSFEAALRSQAAQPCAEVGRFLERVSEVCRATDIELQQVQPISADAMAGLGGWEVQVRARGTFPRFAELLRQIESWSPFIQITSLSVQGGKAPTQNVCELAWTVRVSQLNDEPAVARSPQ